MKLRIEYDEGESQDSIHNLNVASVLYDFCKTLRPTIDISVVGHLLQSQAEHDNRVKDYGVCEKRSVR